jgi:hypothetical protein
MPIARNLVLKLLFIVLLSSLLAACQEVEISHWTGAAKAGEKDEVTRMDAEFLLAYAQRMAQSQDHAGRVTPEYVLEHVQNMEALIREGRELGVTEMAEFRQAVHQYQGELLMRYLQPDLVPEKPRESVTDEDARAFYEENIQNYTQPDRYSVTMAGTRELAAAQALANALARDEVDLETEAGVLGMDLQKVDGKGLQGFPPAWRKTLEAMQPGDHSPLLSSEDRFAIVRLDAFTPGRAQDFEERKEYIRNDTLYAHYRNAWREAYDRLREEHGVRIDPVAAEGLKEGMGRED